MSTTFTDLCTSLAGSARQLVADTAPSLVSIGRHGRGSGVVIAPGLVATNAHNLRDRSTSVGFSDGRTTQGTVLAADAEGDLVVLAVDTADAPALTWADNAGAVVDQGDLVLSVVLGRHGPRVSFGMVSAVGRPFRGPRGRLVKGAIEHTVPLARGASGSPLFDSAGRLVGLNTHRVGDGFYLAVTADAELRRRLDALAAGIAPVRRRLGIAVAPAAVAMRMRRSVGLPERDGLLVRGVEPAGAAAAAGIEAGDLLVRAGEHALVTPDDLHAALDALGDDTAATISLVVIHGIDERTVTVTFGAPAP